MSSTSPVYCFISGGNMHCVPVNTFNDERLPSISVTESNFSLGKSDLAGDLYINDDHDSNEININNNYNNNSRNIDTDSESSSKNNSLSPSVKMKIKNRNLLYTLNNPSLSDLDSDHKNGTLDGSAHLKIEHEQRKPEDFTAHVPDSQESSHIHSIINNYATHAIYLPQYTIDLPYNLTGNFSQIRHLLGLVFPNKWIDESKISFKQVTGGITNMLISCSYSDESLQETVLIRVYGHGTNLIIDRHREFVSHLVLNSLNLAPKIHARFSNGLIYGYLPGRSLDSTELKDPRLYPIIAQQLGNWHNSINIEYIEDGVEKLRVYTATLKRRQSLITNGSNGTVKKSKKDKDKRQKKKLLSNIWELIEDWIEIVPTIKPLIESFNENTPENIIVDESNIRDVISSEFQWLKSTLGKVIKSPIVSSHCDLLSGNIIIPDDDSFKKRISKTTADLLPKLSENPIQFIDYEYMLPAPRAFDIANHLAEWQGFDCDRSAIPKPSIDNPILIKWCQGYLNNCDASESEVMSLINEIIWFYGMPGFYWGIWASIQSEISNIDFNYSEYCKLRFQEYWDWKLSFKEKV